jgi:hypothetical protein
MDHFARLQLVGRITYYVGWIALVLAGFVHFNVARTVFQNIGISQRNLFELAVVSFLVCVASELRAGVKPASEMPSVMKRAA